MNTLFAPPAPKASWKYPPRIVRSSVIHVSPADASTAPNVRSAVMEKLATPQLPGVTTIIHDALRHRPHPTHFTVEEAIAAAARIQPRQTYLTHICHDLPHVATNQALPDGVALAYDGMTFDIEVA